MEHRIGFHFPIHELLDELSLIAIEPRHFAAQSQQFLRLLSAGDLLFRAQLGPLFQSVLEEAANVFDAFDGPLTILFGLVFFSRQFGLSPTGQPFATISWEDFGGRSESENIYGCPDDQRVAIAALAGHR